MKTMFTLCAALTFTVVSTATGCSAGGEATSADDEASAIKKMSSDEAIVKRLEDLSTGLRFYSESDYPFVVVRGAALKSRASTSIEADVRSEMADAVQQNTEDHVDIRDTAIRARPYTIKEVIDDFTYESTNPNYGEEEREERKKNLKLIKYLNSQLDHVSAWYFGESESGDQEGEAPIVLLYIGISRTTGKIIGLMTQVVAT